MLVFRNSPRLKKLFTSSISNGTFFSNKSSHFFKYSTAVSSSNTGDAATATAKAPHLNFVVDFLIHSVGFTRESALTISSKVPRLNSTKNPELVINTFKKYGLDNTHIKKIISCSPKILNCKPHKTLEPKFRLFQEYGFSGSDLVDLLKANENLLKVGLHTRIIHAIDFIRKFVVNDELAFEAFKKSKGLFSISTPANLKRLSVNVLQLQNRGLSNNQILKFITANYRAASINPSIFEQRLIWIVEGLGIPESSPMFFYAVATITSCKKSTLEKKMKIYRSYGWSEEEIATLGRTNPKCISFSEDKIHQALNFFIREQGYSPGYMATHILSLTSSLENTVKPRYKVLQMLKEKKVVPNRYHIASLVAYSKVNFLKFLKRFENELPGLVETYTNSIGKT